MLMSILLGFASAGEKFASYDVLPLYTHHTMQGAICVGADLSRLRMRTLYDDVLLQARDMQRAAARAIQFDQNHALPCAEGQFSVGVGDCHRWTD